MVCTLIFISVFDVCVHSLPERRFALGLADTPLLSPQKTCSSFAPSVVAPSATRHTKIQPSESITSQSQSEQLATGCFQCALSAQVDKVDEVY